MVADEVARKRLQKILCFSFKDGAAWWAAGVVDQDVHRRMVLGETLAWQTLAGGIVTLAGVGIIVLRRPVRIDAGI